MSVKLHFTTHVILTSPIATTHISHHTCPFLYIHPDTQPTPLQTTATTPTSYYTPLPDHYTYTLLHTTNAKPSTNYTLHHYTYTHRTPNNTSIPQLLHLNHATLYYTSEPFTPRYTIHPHPKTIPLHLYPTTHPNLYINTPPLPIRQFTPPTPTCTPHHTHPHPYTPPHISTPTPAIENQHYIFISPYTSISTPTPLHRHTHTHPSIRTLPGVYKARPQH